VDHVEVDVAKETHGVLESPPSPGKPTMTSVLVHARVDLRCARDAR